MTDTDRIFNVLRQLMPEIPKRCVFLQLTLRIGERPRIVGEFIPDPPVQVGGDVLIERFSLTTIEEAQAHE